MGKGGIGNRKNHCEEYKRAKYIQTIRRHVGTPLGMITMRIFKYVPISVAQ